MLMDVPAMELFDPPAEGVLEDAGRDHALSLQPQAFDGKLCRLCAVDRWVRLPNETVTPLVCSWPGKATYSKDLR